MSDEDLKKISDSLINGLVFFVAKRFDLSVFVCPECGSKILDSKKSVPYCLKCHKLMVLSHV